MVKSAVARIAPKRRLRKREPLTDELPSCVRGYLPTAVRTDQADRQKGYSPKLAKITPKSSNAVFHCDDLAVRTGTAIDQARVTGRIG
jgi:hypothetical protein